MQKRMLDVVAAIPGVESVGLSDPLLLNDSKRVRSYAIERPICGRRMPLPMPISTTFLPTILHAEGTGCCPAGLYLA